MSVAESPLLSRQSTPVPQGTLLPTLFGEGYGVYRTRPSAFVVSYAVNFLFTALIVSRAIFDAELTLNPRAETLSI